MIINKAVVVELSLLQHPLTSDSGEEALQALVVSTQNLAFPKQFDF